MRFEPVLSDAALHDQFYPKPCGVFHGLPDKGRDLLLFLAEHVDDQFVVYLEDDFGMDASGGEFTVDAVHGDFDDVGGAALYGGR